MAGRRPHRQPGRRAAVLPRRPGRLRLLVLLGVRQADAGATGTIGPNLNKFLKGKDAKFIQQSIEDPGAYVEKGFQNGIMPTNYKATLQPEQIKALTDYLVKVASK